MYTSHTRERYRCREYGCKLDVCCSGFFVIALVAVPVSSVRYTHCVSILAHNAAALSRARWNNDTIRSTIAAHRRLVQYFPSSFPNGSARQSCAIPFSHFADQGGIIWVDRTPDRFTRISVRFATDRKLNLTATSFDFGIFFSFFFSFFKSRR